MCDEQTIAQLIDDLGGKHFPRAEAAKEKLVECGKSAVEPLMAALQNRNVNPPANFSMPGLNNPDTLPQALQSMFNMMVNAHQTFDAKQIAIVSVLGQIGDERAIEPIIATLQFANPMTFSMIALPLTTFGPKVVEPLINALKSDNANLRKGAAWTLSKIPDIRAVEPLLVALNDTDDGVRQMATEALRTIRDSRAVEALIDILHSDKSENVRQWAAMALDGIPDQRAIEPLINVVRYGNDAETRRLAAHALRHYPNEEVVKTLIAALRDRAEIVSVWARYALDDMQVQARPYLKELHQEQPELIERAYNTWPWDWVNASRQNKYPDLRAELGEMLGVHESQAEAAKVFYGQGAHSCPLCDKPANELAWFYFFTPPDTWENTVGRAGWMTVCDDCHLQVDFFMQAMN